MKITKERRVAVILCTYEPCEYLIEQVDSINNQKNVSVTIFIFDDGTQSSSGKSFLKSIESSVKVISVGEPSKSAGKNFIRSIQSLEVNEFDYVAFSDQDDIWLSDKLSHAISIMEYEKIDGYSSNLIIFDGKKETGILEKSAPQTEYDYHFQGASAGCTYVLSRKLTKVIQKNIVNLDGILSFKKRISHDWLVYYIARTNNFSWFLDSDAKILYRQHDNNVYGARRGVLEKVKMVFGEWYSTNVYFASLFRNDKLDAFDVNISFIRKLRFFTLCLKLRREKFNSFICYLFWLFKYSKKIEKK